MKPELGEVGVSDGNLEIMPMPALVAVLLAKEREKGAPLSEAEVLEIRETAACVMVPHDVVARISEERGYEDIRLEHVWEDWNAVRSSLHSATSVRGTVPVTVPRLINPGGAIPLPARAQNPVCPKR